MELFDEETYQLLNKEYQKALEKSPKFSLDKALRGEIPFSLSKHKDSKELEKCARINLTLLEFAQNLVGQRAEILKSLILLNKKELPDQKVGEQITINRYQNPLIKTSYDLCVELEKAKAKGDKVDTLIARSYAILSACFST